MDDDLKTPASGAENTIETGEEEAADAQASETEAGKTLPDGAEANQAASDETRADETEASEAGADKTEPDAGALWSVGREAQRFFPAALDDTFLRGVTGGALRHGAAPLLRSDLTHWIAPGLAFCGTQAEIVPVPVDEEACLQWLCANMRPGVGVCAFAFSETADENATLASNGTTNSREQGKPTQGKTGQGRLNRGREMAQRDDGEAERLALPHYTDPPLAWEARIVALDRERREVTLLDSHQRASPCTLPELQTYFSHVMLVRKALARPRRPQQRDFALRAWTAFACAYPERLLNMSDRDASERQTCGDFWRALAGRERSEAGQRLRSAADLFQNAQSEDDLDTALRLLYKQMCYELRLPPLVENALLAPDDVVLSDAERRELIYLARAGTRDLKILAAYRLMPESDQSDVCATLLQLQHDADAWVRAAARLP